VVISCIIVAEGAGLVGLLCGGRVTWQVYANVDMYCCLFHVWGGLYWVQPSSLLVLSWCAEFSWLSVSWSLCWFLSFFVIGVPVCWVAINFFPVIAVMVFVEVVSRAIVVVVGTVVFVAVFMFSSDVVSVVMVIICGKGHWWVLICDVAKGEGSVHCVAHPIH